MSVVRDTFRSLSVPNYRLFAVGTLVSNIGTWMQRTAQDWLILTHLAHNNATAIGISMGLQFGPHLLLLPLTGYVADHVDRRKLLIVTQILMSLLSLAIGVLAINGIVQLRHMYLFAFVLGCVTAFDMPARLTFVGELVDDAHLTNAVGLNSTLMNGARMIGPAFSGILIGLVGAGWVFVINAAAFVVAVTSLVRLRVDQLHARPPKLPSSGGYAEGFQYVSKRPDLITVLAMLFLVAAFALNFTIFIVSMSVKVFHSSPSQFGILTSMMALGSVVGSLASARSDRPRMGTLAFSALMLSVTWGLAVLMPQYWLFGAALFLVGAAAQVFTTTSTSAMQLWTNTAMRGRVMAIYLAVYLGVQPLGAPILGKVIDLFSPRAALGVASVAAFAATCIGLSYMVKYMRLRACVVDGRWRIAYESPDSPI